MGNRGENSDSWCTFRAEAGGTFPRVCRVLMQSQMIEVYCSF